MIFFFLQTTGRLLCLKISFNNYFVSLWWSWGWESWHRFNLHEFLPFSSLGKPPIESSFSLPRKKKKILRRFITCALSLKRRFSKRNKEDNRRHFSQTHGRSATGEISLNKLPHDHRCDLKIDRPLFIRNQVEDFFIVTLLFPDNLGNIFRHIGTRVIRW